MYFPEGTRDVTDQLTLFKEHALYNNKGTILQAIVESRCSQTLQVCLEVDKGRQHIIECLNEELQSDPTFIHKVCATPLLRLLELADENILTSRDSGRMTPLMKAVEARQPHIVEHILSKESGRKTVPETQSVTEMTALMIACWLGFSEIVKLIMENSDVNINQKDVERRTIFHYAAKHHDVLGVVVDICQNTEKYQNYKVYLKLEDKHGYTALHHAASSGSYENVRVLLESGVCYNKRCFRSRRTALHYAACSNVETLKVLLHFVKRQLDSDGVKAFIDAVDSRLQTSLHIAASMGKWHTVSLLLENGASIKCDDENETPLHLACYEGSTRTIELLLQSNPAIVNHENRVGETPAMFAAVNGKTETLKMLIMNDASLWAQSDCVSVEKRKTCLDWAVMNKREDTVKAILKHEDWKETMKRSYFGSDGLLARMVVSMPDLAIDVLNKCVKTGGADSNIVETTYDFFALQTTEGRRSCGKVSNHVTAMTALETMAKYSNNECLDHVVVQKFLDQKWSLRARKWYLSCLLIYAMFLLSFTLYVTLVTEGHAANKVCFVSEIICYVFAILSVIKECFQLFHQRLHYFCMISSYMELAMYICVFIYIPYEKKSNLQRQAGAIAIFLAWINFTWFLKRFPTYGIYIIMAKKILVTFIQVFVPVSFFIVAFAMAFFVLLHNDDEDEAFANIVSSFVTSFVMMVGEVDYRDAFLQMKSKNFVLILMFLVLFLVFMSILIMNLLTGLAVGDIGTIMKSSLAEKQRQKAMLMVEMDRYLNKYPCFEAAYLEPLTVKNERKNCVSNCAQKLKNRMLPRLDIEDDWKDKEKQECDTTKMKRQLKTMQRTLDELTAFLQKSQTQKRTRSSFAE